MFSATTPDGRTLIWDDTFTGDPELLTLVTSLIESGEGIYTIPTGPFPHAGERPGWVAWFTAHAALDGVPVEWAGEQPSSPADIFELPEGWLA